jgi:regulator of RNase E activity RraA
MALKPATRSTLMGVSTATLCTALFKRGLRNQFIQDVRPLNPNLPNMVGEAFTLRYIPAREDLNPMTVFQDPKHPQRVAIEECPPGAVMVIDSRKDARAASAGSILITRLMVRGAAGAVTDGGFRDSPEIAQMAIPAYHARPSAPTNLTLHQAIDMNLPIACGDVAVFPGDVVVGDAEGVVGPAELDEVGRAPAAQRVGRLEPPLVGGGDLSEPRLLPSLPLRVERGDERVVGVGHGRDPVAHPGGLPVRRALLGVGHDEVVGVAEGGGEEVVPEGLRVPAAMKVQRG